MWNAWTAPPGALPRDYDPWSCEAHCARCGELVQDCHCDDDDDDMTSLERKALIDRLRRLAELGEDDNREWVQEIRTVVTEAADALSAIDDDSSNEDQYDIDDRTR
jgi:hypothetical protein